VSSQVETVFRREWGRAVAVVTRLTGDLGVAEDAVQEAFALALDRWPAGQPKSTTIMTGTGAGAVPLARSLASVRSGPRT